MNSDPSTPSAFFRRASADDPAADAERSLPSDIMDRATRRLRALALLYAFVFFMASLFPTLVDADASEFARFREWGVDVIAITIALVVAGATTLHRLPRTVIINGGLVFQVVGSYGIAMAQYWGVYRDLPYSMEHLEVFGLSWVALWMMLYAIVVPTRPGKALIAAVASASSVPVILALSMRYGGTSIALRPVEWGLGLILPYVLVIIMTHVGARAIYSLGREVAKAREMGSYHLVEPLGTGGMGEVWRAEHRMLVRPAAIKLVRPEALARGGEGETVTLQRFKREAQATAMMRSPHTIELYDFGVSADGTFYYVMELLDGYDIETLVREYGPMPAARAVRILRQVCDSLGEAHERGLIHRDIKPANVFVCRYGRDVDFVKVLDFGLVKHHGQQEREVKVTGENVVGGTPSYMSPEQATGDQDIDGRSDIYALGCVAYWMVTGQLVFERATAVQVMMAHLQKTPEAPSKRTELDVPPDFDALVLRCLEKDPAHRPQDADELAILLDGCACGDWTAQDAREWWASVGR